MCGDAGELADDKLIGDPEEVQPLHVERPDEPDILPRETLPHFVDVEDRRRDQRRDLGVVNDDNDVLPEGCGREVTLTEETQRHDVRR